MQVALEAQMAKPSSAPRTLAELAEMTLGPALAAQGFASREIIAHWEMIAGARLAGHCRPQKISWPRRRGSPDEDPEAAALILKVESAFALEAQQFAPLIIQRVNMHLGWKAVDRIVLKQGPVDLKAASDLQKAEAGPVPEPLKRAVAKISNPDLKEAMLRLGQAISEKSKA